VYQGKENVDRAVIFIVSIYKKSFPVLLPFPYKTRRAAFLFTLPPSLPLSLPPSLSPFCLFLTELPSLYLSCLGTTVQPNRTPVKPAYYQ